MKKNMLKVFSLLLVMLFLCGVTFEYDAYARAGGGRSSGSSGSRSYSPPSRSTSNPATPSQPSTAPAPAQPAGGGFLRSMGGGLLGGMLGGMLLGSLFGFGGMGGSGFGLLEILLLGAVGYFVFTMIMRKKRESALAYQGSGSHANVPAEESPSYGRGVQMQAAAIPTTMEGMAYVRQMDPSFDETRFKDTAMDIFFKIQGAWGNRDLSAVSNLLTTEMKNLFQQDISGLLQGKKINHLENIAVRKTEIIEVWQESGQDYIRVIFTANLLDYTVDEATGAVVAGSKTEPVKFEECWTFTRPVGDNPWKLSAINQV